MSNDVNATAIDSSKVDAPTVEVTSAAPNESAVPTPVTNVPVEIIDSSSSDTEAAAPTVGIEVEPAAIVEAESPEKVETVDGSFPVEAEVDELNPFEEMGLSPDVLEAIEKAGYTAPSDIQAETIPIVLANLDIIGQAETGSGKTAAFALPLLSKIDMDARKPQVLVLAPTRELAIQVTASFQKYANKIKGFRAVTIYGGQNYDTQIRALKQGVQVVVGTPGRVMDHIRRQTLDLSALKTFVLDEADEMLRMGFVDDVEWILEHIPRERQTVMFSATMPDAIRRIARQHLRNPKHITIESRTATADSIKQMQTHVHPRAKTETLDRILQTEDRDAVLVFTKTRTTTVVVAEYLSQRGYRVAALNGDIPQNQRERTVNQLKSGRIDIVIATDVAARGLDVDRISHVINYDFPHDTEAYVHRIGRTGRAGRDGTAILFVEPKEKGKLSRLQRATNQKIALLKQKSLDEVNDLRVEKFLQKVSDTAKDPQIEMFGKIIARHQKETDQPIEEIAAALAVLAQGNVPLILKEIAPQRFQASNDSRGRDRGPRRDNSEMTTYRIEVGKNHGVGPGNIVGAVTNEASLSNSSIGRIALFDEFSLIDLPKDLPSTVIDLLKNVYVSNRQLDIKKDSGGRSSGGRPSYSKKNNGSTRFGKRFEKGSKPKRSYSDRSGASADARPTRKPSAAATTDRSAGTKTYGDKPKTYGDKPKTYGDKPKSYGSKPYAGKATRKTGSGKPKPASKRKAGPSSEGPVRKYVKIRSSK